MRRSTSVVVGALVAFAMNPSHAATVTATPSAGTVTAVGDNFNVVVTLNLGIGEAVDAVQFGLDLTSSQSVFAVSNLTGPVGFETGPFENVQTPGPNGVDQISTGAFSLPPSGLTGTVQLASFTLTALGPGSVDLVVFTDSAYFLSGTELQVFSGTIASFSSAAPEPGAMVLMSFGLVVAALVGRRSGRRG